MFQANTLSKAYQLARMQEATNIILKPSGQLHSIEVIAEGDLDNYIDGDDETYEDCVGDTVVVKWCWAFGEVEQVLTQFAEVFEIPKDLPPRRSHDHQIPLMPNTPPINVRPYRYPPNQKDAIEGMVKKLMDSGVIRASQSPFSSPIVMVKKKDGTEEPDNSLSMGDEHLDTIPATESDEVIKSSVNDLVLIPSESEGILDTMCDVHLVNNPTSLEAKDHFEIVINSNDDYSSSDNDSLYNENIKYVEALPHDSELVSLEVAEIVISEDEEIEDDNLREKLLKVNLLIAKIEALKDNSTPSFEFLTKSSSTFPKSVLEETNTFDDSFLEFKNLCFDLEEISSGGTTTHSDISLSDYEAFSFYDGHIEEISSGSTTTHSDISLSEYDSFIFDLLNDQCPPTDMSDFTHEEFADELAHIISPLEYDCFYFGNLPDPGEWISSLNSGIRENLSSITRVNFLVEDDHSPLLAYVLSSIPENMKTLVNGFCTQVFISSS
nr:reverse transcriptase [Tanacetum cinerariifolium]